MFNTVIANKKRSYESTEGKPIYQYANGGYLPDSSQPYSEKPQIYTPHESTRYRNVEIGSNGIAKMIIDGQALETEKRLPELYQHRENCCGCTACYAICPISRSDRQNDETKSDYLSYCISMEPDEEGFLYPVVDALVCIRCYKCMSVCSFKKDQEQKGYMSKI